ncbi:MAG: RDD family protein [Xanthomonadales bacterium]|nr:RDD family protein [Xanthomonadales bacterium]
MTARPLLDTRIEIETPEGIRLYLLPAGMAPRAIAWVLDLVLRLIVLWLLGLGLLFMGRAGSGLHMIAMFALMWLYPVLFELFWRGQTPGKRVLGLRVVHADGTPVGWVASATRNLLRTFDMLPFGYAVGVVSSLLDGRSRRLGDMAAGTLVVHVPPPPRAHASIGAAPVDPPPLQRGEREALIEFGERHAQLSAERQLELAGLLQPLSGRAGEAGLQQVLGMAAALTGQRGNSR